MSTTIPTPDAAQMPDAVFASNGALAAAQFATELNIRWLLGELGLIARFDLMRRETRFSHAVHAIKEDVWTQDETLEFVCDMALRLRIKDLGRVRELVSLIAKRNPFHPMLEWVDSADWDGVDRFEELAATVPTDTRLWPVFLRKWFYQVCEAISGDEGNRAMLPHVLVFTGAQGVGKTSWVSSLAPDYVMTGGELQLNSPSAKDSMLQALAFPIVELGEIDSSFKKSDVSALKVFLSREQDTLRAPYGRKAETRKRRTAFFGTVNHDEFLVDLSGTRRFWPVEVTGPINFKHGISLQQLWAQAMFEFDELQANGVDAPWVLLAEEEAERAAAAEKHVMEPTAIQAIRESFAISGTRNAKGEDTTTYCIANGTEIMQMVGLVPDNPFVVAEVKAFLRRELGKDRKLQLKKRSWCVPKLIPTRGNGVRANPPGVVTLEREEAKKYLAEQEQNGARITFGVEKKEDATENNVTPFPNKKKEDE